ncbi:MAG TPA: fibronectin type III domain-containing protein [Candidatus Kapabacteria bacterium]|nr:fibronectin type III domain-containing protein [Candidatus Kapabacteria bacterium]
MKKLTTVLSSLALAAAGAFFFASCTNPSSPAVTVGAPTNLEALSKDANTISIKWTRGANDTAAESVSVASNGTTTSTVQEPATVTSLDLTTLSTGTVYTITVTSSGGSVSIPWMTAVRTPGLRLYQFSSGQQSGLQLNGPGGHAAVVSAASANISTMDFYLEDVEHDNTITTSSGLSFEGPQFLNDPSKGETWRNSYFQDDQLYVHGGLDSTYSATDFSTFLANPSAGHNSYDIPDVQENDRVLTVATQDGNVARIDIVPDATTGKLYSGSGTNKYITVNVSYQPIAGKPYAARPHPFQGVREPRNSVK